MAAESVLQKGLRAKTQKNTNKLNYVYRSVHVLNDQTDRTGRNQSKELVDRVPSQTQRG